MKKSYYFSLFSLFLLINSSLAESENVSTDDENLQEVVVISTGLGQEEDETVQPITVVSEDEIRDTGVNNIGDLLSNQAGVANSGFGPGANRPVIRGLGQDRVRVLENSTGTGDVSNTSPDHLVTIDPSLIEKVEIIRGPAALLYGSTAVGGVVNALDNRIPESLPKDGVDGFVEMRGGTVDDEKTGVAKVNAGVGKFVIHADGFARETNSVRIPGFARTEERREGSPELEYEEPRGRLTFSDTDSNMARVGGTYVGDDALFGLSLSDYNSVYGVPNGENDISIDSSRKRLDLKGKILTPVGIFESMEFLGGINHYEHTEFEGEESGTEFVNNSYDLRFTANHKKIGALSGLIGAQLQNSRFKAIGDEAFISPSESLVPSLFALEEYQINDKLKLQAGIRGDYNDLETQGFPDQGRLGREIFATSGSFGFLYEHNKSYSSALSLARTERSPVATELFSNGPHIATGAFEVGDTELSKERSMGIDYTLRKIEGDFRGSISAYYNHFNDYIALVPTGEIEDDLAVYNFRQVDADFFGFDSDIQYYLVDTKGESMFFDVRPDFVYAINRDDNSALARITPFRTTFGFNYDLKDVFRSRLEYQQVARQFRNADEETETPSYSLVNLSLSKDIKINEQDFEIFLRGRNLLNQKIRDHVSFLKDIAPMPGIGATVGLRVKF